MTLILFSSLNYFNPLKISMVKYLKGKIVFNLQLKSDVFERNINEMSKNL